MTLKGSLQRLLATFLFAFAATAAHAAEPPIEIKVVVVTMFEIGKDSGDMAGEFQLWHERQKLDEKMEFAHHHDLFLNRKTGVLGMVTGMGWGEALSVLYLAVLATLLAYTLWTRLLSRHPAAKVAPFSLLVPVVGLWAASMAFGERLQPLQWLGAACVLSGLVINQVGGRWVRSN